MPNAIFPTDKNKKINQLRRLSFPTPLLKALKRLAGQKRASAQRGTPEKGGGGARQAHRGAARRSKAKRSEKQTTPQTPNASSTGMEQGSVEATEAARQRGGAARRHGHNGTGGREQAAEGMRLTPQKGGQHAAEPN